MRQSRLGMNDFEPMISRSRDGGLTWSDGEYMDGGEIDSLVVSPSGKQQMWLDVGMATYSEMLYVEETAGRGAADELGREFSVAALSNDTSAITRSQNLEEYSPEYDAVLSKKAAVVMNMLRNVVGDEGFFLGLRNLASIP